MNDIKLEAMILAAVHLYRLIECGSVALPNRSEIDLDEFSDIAGEFHSLVENYEESLKFMAPKG